MVVVTRADLKDDEQSLYDYLSDGEGEKYTSFEAPVDVKEKYARTIFVTNMPVSKKIEKLTKVFHEALVNLIGCKSEDVVVEIPVNQETGESHGCCIAVFTKAIMAMAAVKAADGHAFDKNITLRAFLMSEVCEMLKKDACQVVDQTTLNSCVRHDERNWLMDNKGREQILIRHTTETEICWYDHNQSAPELFDKSDKEKGHIWCDSYVQWSNWGSFLCTFHQKGIARWAGDEFVKRNRFESNFVKYVAFSPDEEYMVTWNGSPYEADPERQMKDAVKIFHVRSGVEKRAFPTPKCSPQSSPWPLFVWSHDSQYFARMTDKEVYVYSVADFMVIPDPNTQKRSPFKFDRLNSFSWSPRKNVLAVSIPEMSKGNEPARIRVIDVETRMDLSVKTLFNIKDCQLHWQSEGHFLCVQAQRISKSKKPSSTSLEIFRMNEKNIPVELVDIVDNVMLFSWEPRGNRFAVITKSDDGRVNQILCFQVGKKVEQVASYQLPTDGFNCLKWSPYGNHFVTAVLERGELLFMTLTAQNNCELFHADQHFLVGDVEWDPSGRYIISSVTSPMGVANFRYQTETGYIIWSFQGRQLYKKMVERLWQIKWRPHPPSLLSEDAIKDIKNDLKEKSKKYDHVDEQAKDQQRRAVAEARVKSQEMMNAIFMRLRMERENMWNECGFSEAVQRFQKAQQWEEITTVTETELSKVEEIIQDEK